MEGEDDAYDAEDIEKLLAEAKTMNEARSKNGGSMAESEQSGQHEHHFGGEPPF